MITIKKKSMRNKFPLAIAISILLSGFSYAATAVSVIGTISAIINMIIPLILALAVLAFFWGLMTFLFSGAEEKKKGINIMVFGLIAIFVMVSLWGLVRMLQATFRIDKGSPIIPDVIERNYYR